MLYTITTTKRLLIRKFEISDAEFVMDLVNAPKWLQYVGDKNLHTIQDAEQYIINTLFKSYETNGFGFYVVELKSDKTPVGITGFGKRDYLDVADIGFGLMPQFEKQGFAFEASKACMEYGIKTFGFTKLNGITMPENQPSRDLLKKLGLTYQKTIAEPNTNVSLTLYSVDLTM